MTPVEARTEQKSERGGRLTPLAVRGGVTAIHVYVCRRCNVQEAFVDRSDATDWHWIMGLAEEIGRGAFFCGNCFHLIRAIAHNEPIIPAPDEAV